MFCLQDINKFWVKFNSSAEQMWKTHKNSFHPLSNESLHILRQPQERRARGQIGRLQMCSSQELKMQILITKSSFSEVSPSLYPCNRRFHISNFSTGCCLLYDINLILKYQNSKSKTSKTKLLKRMFIFTKLLSFVNMSN